VINEGDEEGGGFFRKSRSIRSSLTSTRSPLKLGALAHIQRARRVVKPRPFDRNPTPQQLLADTDLASNRGDGRSVIDHQMRRVVAVLRGATLALPFRHAGILSRATITIPLIRCPRSGWTSDGRAIGLHPSH